MMKKLTYATLTITLLTGCAGYMNEPVAKNMAHVHMAHVTASWNDTPESKGLLTTAMSEAEIAVQHAGFAAAKMDNLKWIKAHIGHVAHAVDPAAAGGKGPGLGYGVLKAAKGVAAHIGFAAASDAASKNVKGHAVHVSASAGNVVAWSGEILALASQVKAATSAVQAAPLVTKIQMLAGQLAAGVDANGDGKITWKKGEGGLGEAAKHMGFMKKGENIQ